MSVSYTLRLPDNLKVLLDIAAAKHGQSLASYIVGACWAQLEGHGGDGTVVVDGRDRADDLFVPANPTSASDVVAAKEASRIARHLPKQDVALSLRRMVAPELTAAGLEAAGVEPAPVCMACEGPTVEGQGKSAGMWACQDVSCPRYGIEVKR